jgi:hypothetical protein
MPRKRTSDRSLFDVGRIGDADTNPACTAIDKLAAETPYLLVNCCTEISLMDLFVLKLDMIKIPYIVKYDIII